MATWTMQGVFRPTINLGNSIVGVSILAMPWCLKECGVALGIILLVTSGMLTTWSCKMLIRAAYMKSKLSYESLGHAAYSRLGKLMVEISVIGLNFGTCIAFFVIIGDLAPPIVAQATGVTWSPGFLRACVLVVLAVCVAFPLSLMRNIDSLSAISISSLLFYSSLIVQLTVMSYTNFSTGVWWSHVVLWRWTGVLRCLPIFSLAFACHTQLFVIYSALADPTVRKMSTVINGAIGMVGTGYGLVAIFGYVTFCTGRIQGDVLSNFPLSLLAQVTRFGFAVSVVVSFPLMIFPCRGSINSLLFSQSSMELHVSEPIPPKRFNAITAAIIGLTLTIAIIIPQIETVLALTGSTMGTLISYIFPSLFFLQVAGPKAEFTRRAKLMLCLGFSIMVVSTTVTITNYGAEDIKVVPARTRPYKLHDGAKQVPVMGGGRAFSEPLPDLDAARGGAEGGGMADEGGGADSPQGRVEGKLVEPELPVAGEELAVADKEKADLHEKLVEEILEVKDRLKQVEAANQDLKVKQEELELQQVEEAAKHQELEGALQKDEKEEGIPVEVDPVILHPDGGQEAMNAQKEGVQEITEGVAAVTEGVGEVRDPLEQAVNEEAPVEKEVELGKREEVLSEVDQGGLPDVVAPQVLQQEEEDLVVQSNQLGDVQGNVGDERVKGHGDVKGNVGEKRVKGRDLKEASGG